jgi:hypothetical protein
VQWHTNEQYNFHDEDAHYDQGSSQPLAGFNPVYEFSRVLEANNAIHDQEKHHQLKDDLVEHLWQKFGEEQS